MNDKILENDEFDYPKPKTNVFIAGKNPRTSSHIGWNNDLSQFWGYSEGYKTAADSLIEKMLQDGHNLSLDTMIFPAIFCYRQYLELSMKNIIISGRFIEEGRKLPFSGHDLMNLWGNCKTIICDYNKVTSDNSDTKILNLVKKYIKEFSQVDFNSEYFRYPINKEEGLHHTKHISIDLENLMKRMNELYNFFEGCRCMIDELNDAIMEEKVMAIEYERELMAEIEAEMKYYY